MSFHIPDKCVSSAKSVLIMGIGGGLEFIFGLPIYQKLKAMGKKVYLANFTSTNLAKVKKDTEVLIENYLATTSNGCRATFIAENQIHYYPEAAFCAGYSRKSDSVIKVYMFAKTGVIPLANSLRYLAQKLSLDTVFLVDAGASSLMAGDEDVPGPFIERAVCIQALDSLRQAVSSYLVCGGFGAESDLGIRLSNVFENIGDITQNEGFIGATALVNSDDVSFMRYMHDYVAHNWLIPHPENDVISRTLNASLGKYGAYPPANRGTHILSLSMLHSIYWFFASAYVLSNSEVKSYLGRSITIEDAYDLYRMRIYASPMEDRKTGFILPY